MLREQIRLETPLGLEAKKLIDQGVFVPDEVVVGMISELLNQAGEDQNFLFDGFPRTLVQARQLDEMLQGLEGDLTDVFLLECPDDVIVERLSGRRTCNTCGAVYHIKFNPPCIADRCDVDGCELQFRADDSAETVQKRLDIYAEQTAPLISYYQAQGLVRTVNAARGIGDVRNAVLERMV
jgi:adenylate kinase